MKGKETKIITALWMYAEGQPKYRKIFQLFQAFRIHLLTRLSARSVQWARRQRNAFSRSWSLVHFSQRLICLLQMIHYERCLLQSCKLHSTSSGTIFITITPKEYRRPSEREIWLERKSPARWSSCCIFPRSSGSVCRAVLSICRLGLVVQNGKLFFNKLRQAQWRCSLEHWRKEDCWSLDYWFLNYKWPHG